MSEFFRRYETSTGHLFCFEGQVLNAAKCACPLVLSATSVAEHCFDLVRLFGYGFGLFRGWTDGRDQCDVHRSRGAQTASSWHLRTIGHFHLAFIIAHARGCDEPIDGDVHHHSWLLGAVHGDIGPSSCKINSYGDLHRDFPCHELAQFEGPHEEWHSRQMVLWQGHPEGCG